MLADEFVTVASTVTSKESGAEGDRTPDLMTASHALSQLSYGPGRVAEPDTRLRERRAPTEQASAPDAALAQRHPGSGGARLAAGPPAPAHSSWVAAVVA